MIAKEKKHYDLEKLTAQIKRLGVGHLVALSSQGGDAYNLMQAWCEEALAVSEKAEQDEGEA